MRAKMRCGVVLTLTGTMLLYHPAQACFLFEARAQIGPLKEVMEVFDEARGNVSDAGTRAIRGLTEATDAGTKAVRELTKKSSRSMKEAQRRLKEQGGEILLLAQKNGEKLVTAVSDNAYALIGFAKDTLFDGELPDEAEMKKIRTMAGSAVILACEKGLLPEGIVNRYTMRALSDLVIDAAWLGIRCADGEISRKEARDSLIELAVKRALPIGAKIAVNLI